jgi:methionine-gamma-lyase
MTLDIGSLAKANALMELMQSRNLGYLAVSLGFYKTLFSAPGTSDRNSFRRTSRNGINWWFDPFSIGLDNDIARTYEMMKACMQELYYIIQGCYKIFFSFFDQNP